jgi:hypothetical protein
MMNKEQFIEATISSLNLIEPTKPKHDLFNNIWLLTQQNAIVIKLVSYPKVAAIAAAFVGLFIINIWLLKIPKQSSNKDLQNLVQQYGLVNDDIIPLSQ